MVSVLLFFHSFIRWLVLVSLVYSILRAAKGVFYSATFSKLDNACRHWTATILHLQLIVGALLYVKSPIIKFFYNNYQVAKKDGEVLFFAELHALLMLIAVVILTIGSAIAKRKVTDEEKFKTMLVWFSVTLLIILLAIPWPFSPFVNRPYFRPF